MYQTIFLYTGAGLTFLWGVAHLFPTRPISAFTRCVPETIIRP